MSADITTLDAASIEAFTRGEGLAVVDFWAPWCGPCRALQPTLQALAEALGGQVRFGKLNVDEAPELARRLQLRGIPTLMMFRRGRLADQRVGLHSHDQLAAWLRRGLDDQQA